MLHTVYYLTQFNTFKQSFFFFYSLINIVQWTFFYHFYYRTESLWLLSHPYLLYFIFTLYYLEHCNLSQSGTVITDHMVVPAACTAPLFVLHRVWMDRRAISSVEVHRLGQTKDFLSVRQISWEVVAPLVFLRSQLQQLKAKVFQENFLCLSDPLASPKESWPGKLLECLSQQGGGS